MKPQTLIGTWEFRQVGKDVWMPASVPGGVHTDLMALGSIPDPFAGDNERRLQWIAEADWEYRVSFEINPELISMPHIFLVCDGLDTLATVVLNGQELGQTNNMFRCYEWEVRPLLDLFGENRLSITFASPVKFITQENSARELPGPYHSLAGGPYIRKAPCQFGWDWGPQLPPIGIWKDIRLEGYHAARFKNVHIRQEHLNGNVAIEVHGAAEQWENASLEIIARLIAPGGEVFEKKIALPVQGEGDLKIPVPNPQLWWPNGYGEQPLYQLEVSLNHAMDSESEPEDLREFQIGLRTIELRQQPDQWGRSFAFLVNGVQIFAKGSNWIPADSFPTRIGDHYLEGLICAAAETHHNMLRVWGGGFYEEERFYDLCDRYGILVWQEFIFSCSIYPLNDPGFLENVHQEVVENVRRLRHRASLALWCGNNEMEWGWVEWDWKNPELQDLKSAYDQYFHHTLPAWCLAEDPDHVYWPSSPSSDTPFIDPNGQVQGDAHYWDVWHRGQPFTAYRNQYPRFMSEFGFQALPPLATIQTYADKVDWNMTSYIMEQHQKNSSGNALIVRQMLDMFRLPMDFESLVYLSMVLQAEGIRYGVEHWRRHPDRVAGILYWQLNDCWPVASWSSLDYFGRWKALHYAARRFYAPILLSVEDKPPRQAVYITNDTLAPVEGYVRWYLESFDGEEMASGEMEARVPPQAAVQVCDLDFTDRLGYDNLRQTIFIAELWQAEQLISRQTAGFAPIKHLSLTDPTFKVDLRDENGLLIAQLTSSSLALLVEVSLADADVVFSDNYFNLPVNRVARITCPMPEGWSLQRAKQEFRVRSIFSTY